MIHLLCMKTLSTHPPPIRFRLFIIEGAPSVVAACVAAWYLPNTPETAKFLNEDERKLEIERLATGK